MALPLAPGYGAPHGTSRGVPGTAVLGIFEFLLQATEIDLLWKVWKFAKFHKGKGKGIVNKRRSQEGISTHCYPRLSFSTGCGISTMSARIFLLFYIGGRW